VGGGNWPHPGEISLAHRGVLFLDELPEFGPRVLEVMRQPIEDKVVTISRAQGSLTFPANFQLIAAMNPCPCGYYGDSLKPCTCMGSKHINHLSPRWLDQFMVLAETTRMARPSFNPQEPGTSWFLAATCYEQLGSCIFLRAIGYGFSG
jgi:magnesium chelatase family protein